jgi:hypothetical protein
MLVQLSSGGLKAHWYNPAWGVEQSTPHFFIGDNMKIHFKDIEYGFEYGAATIERCCSSWEQGWVVLTIKTKKVSLQICITKSGEITITDDKEVVWKSNPKRSRKSSS